MIKKANRRGFIDGLRKAKSKTSQKFSPTDDLTKMSDDQLAQIVKMANQINELKANQALREAEQKMQTQTL